jgi:DDE superfamily endonuclease
VQVAIDAETRLVIATGDPQPGSHNDCTVYRDSGIAEQLADRPVMADGGYQGNAAVVMPYRKPRDGSELPNWKEDLNATHRTIRARVEHVLARMKNFKILRDYRRAAYTLADIATLHNILLTD